MNEWADDLEDREFPDSPDDDESIEVVPCPECGADVYEEAPQCPHCGAYITYDTSIWAGRHPWWILLGLLGIVAVIVALAMGP